MLTDFWKHFQVIQTTSGILSFLTQTILGFNIEEALTYKRIVMISVMAVLEKVDFVKDIQVAALPHKNQTNAFLMWMSIYTPTLTVFIYYIYIKKWW